ncbi:MAG: PAS domain S-box protein [Candidatus Thermoplasmatota archaeon]|nr:PAS domain S-box protein [Candidatus Thermoplasmatota archaeon]
MDVLPFDLCSLHEIEGKCLIELMKVNLVRDVPKIVEQLKKEDKLGLLVEKTQHVLETFERQDHSSDKGHSDKSVRFVEENIIDNPLSKKENIERDLSETEKENERLRKMLKESKERYDSLAEYFETISNAVVTLGKRDLFSDVSDIIFQLSPSGKITYINSAVEEIAGYSTSEMIGCNCYKLISKKGWSKVIKKLFSKKSKKKLAGSITNFETAIIHKNGSLIPVEITGKIIKQGEEVIGRKTKIRFQGSIRDVTERKQAEEERRKHAERLRSMNEELTKTNEELTKTQQKLHLLNEELEQKVQDRTAEINSLLKRKDEFIIQLGHDLKSPLTPLIGLLPMVMEREDDPQLLELLNVISRNIQYMRDLVVKTLQLERLNSPTTLPNIDMVNLLEIVDDLVQNKQLVFEQKHLAVEVKIDKNVVVQADHIQLKELVDNLLTNAVKFTPDGGHIIIHAKNGKKEAVVSVSDTGTGMTKEQINRSFETFYKVDPARHDLESSGLGLPICKRIVEKHGGKLWAESDGLGKGTTFYFTLPKQ